MNSSFVGILGYDAINKLNIQIRPDLRSCTIKDSIIPFINLDQQVTNVTDTQMLHNLENDENIIKTFKVYLHNKIIIQSQDQVYVKVFTNLHPSLLSKIFLFEPNMYKKNIAVQEAIYSFENNLSSLHDTSGNLCTVSFYILINNNTEHPFHLNKSTVVGSLTEVAETKTPFQQHNETSNNNNNIINEDIPTTSESINVITPSMETVRLRKEEFDIKDFQINHLTTHEKAKLSNLLYQNYQVFSKSLKAIGHTDKIIPQIRFTSSFPVRTLPFPIPHSLQEEAKRQIQELIEAGIIKKHLSSWACPMLLVKKKSLNSTKQSYRLALDLRLINSIIESATYPLPKINVLIANLSKFKFFTSLDMPSAYHQLNLPKEFQDKLSFVTPWATYCYTRMVFGLKTAASSFQALMDAIIEECNIDGLMAYQDDLIVASNSFDETVQKLSILFEVLKKNNITLFAPKCSFHQKSVNYLGFQISENKIFPIQSNIVKITSFPSPKNKKQLKTFLGTAGFYRNLIPAYAQITSILVQLTSPKVPFKWTPAHEEAFRKIQNIFFSRPFIQQPDFTKVFYLNTDASKAAIAAILMQKHGDQLLPISYFSRTLKKSEANYEPMKLELLAIVKGVEAFHYYLYAKEFIILSDSKPLKHFKKTSSPSDLVTRWLSKLSEYSFIFQYIPGSRNLIADLFSRTNFSSSNISDLSSDPNLVNSNEVLPVVVNHVSVSHPGVHHANNNHNISHFTQLPPGCDLSKPPPNFYNLFSQSNSINNNGLSQQPIAQQEQTLPKYIANQAPPSMKNAHCSCHNVPTIPHSTCVTNTPRNFCQPTSYVNHNNHRQHQIYNLSQQNINTAKDPNIPSDNQKKDPLLEIPLQTILQEQLKDSRLASIYNDLVDNKKSNKTKNFFIDTDTMLLMHAHDKNVKYRPRLQIALPNSLKQKALRIAHMGHLGIHKTFQKVQQKYFWYGAYADTSNFVKSCTICLKIKNHNIPAAPFQNNPIPKHPGDFISMDILGPFQNGQHILTIIDHHSRHLVLYALKTISSENVIKSLFDYITVHGRPSLVLTDLGRQFTSQIFNQFLNNFGIRLIHASINHPQTNSLSERVNQSIKATIGALQCEGYNFENALKIHQMIYNSSVHSTTKMAPNLVHFGRHLSSLYDTYLVNDENIVLNANRVYYHLNKDLQNIYKKVYHNLLTAQKLQNQKQTGAKYRNIKINDIVYLKNVNPLKKGFEGPYQVLQITSPVNVKIQRYGEPTAPILHVHMNRLWIAAVRREHLQDTNTSDHSHNTNLQQNVSTPSDAQQSPAQTNSQSHMDQLNSSINSNDTILQSQTDTDCDMSNVYPDSPLSNSSTYDSPNSTYNHSNDTPSLSPHVDEVSQRSDIFSSPPCLSGPYDKQYEEQSCAQKKVKLNL